MKLASFFAGIGGFDLGFERAGFSVVFQCEIDPHCQMVLRRHWPAIPLHDDILTLEPGEIPYADVWSAGWPCQDLSHANAQREGLDGKRSGLFYRFADLARKAKPRWIILENVIGLLSADRGEALETVIDELEEIGYMGGWTTANTLHFGLPQNRKRVIIVASLGNDGAHRVIADGCELQRDHSSGNKEWPGSANPEDPSPHRLAGQLRFRKAADAPCAAGQYPSMADGSMWIIACQGSEGALHTKETCKCSVRPATTQNQRNAVIARWIATRADGLFLSATGPSG